jgi:hypothetical protein
MVVRRVPIRCDLCDAYLAFLLVRVGFSLPQSRDPFGGPSHPCGFGRLHYGSACPRFPRSSGTYFSGVRQLPSKTIGRPPSSTAKTNRICFD